jgi:tyrosine-protein kinase Etk/Wzc
VISSVVYAFVRREFLAGVDDPDLIKRRFNLPIFGAIAFSAGQAGSTLGLSAKTPAATALRNVTALPASRSATQPLLSMTHPFDTSIEGLRELTHV